jgi:hypothetical protein
MDKLSRYLWSMIYDHNFHRFRPFSTIFDNFWRFSTIFGDFRQFSAKTNVMIKFYQNLALFRVKNANFFAEFFGEKS